METPLIWGYLVHLGFNMWVDWYDPSMAGTDEIAQPQLRFDDALWDELLAAMPAAGVNLLLFELGDGVCYDRHPELAVEGAWTPARLTTELARVRAAGMEPIPLLNFSTAHDLWLGEYARCVSTERYYRVCTDLIDEVISLFDGPRFVHLGMDEEGLAAQQHLEYVVIRQHDLWWRDFSRLVEQVERQGARAWIWSDYAWDHRQEFVSRMHRSVVQSNWYYRRTWSPDTREAATFLDLDRGGFEQIPCGTNWSYPDNFDDTVEFCRKHLTGERLLGFMQTCWKPTLRARRDRHMAALERLHQAQEQWMRN